MGFGILIFGYFAMFAFARSPYYFFADIIGAFVAVFALSKLGEYSRRFYGAMFAALAFLVVCAVNAASLLFSLYPMGEGAAWTAVEILKLAAGCAMHVFLFLGIRTLAERAGIERLASKSLGRLVATVIYYAAAFLAILLSPVLDEKTASAAGIGIWLFWILCLILNLILLLFLDHPRRRGRERKAPFADRIPQRPLGQIRRARRQKERVPPRIHEAGDGGGGSARCGKEEREKTAHA